MDEEVVKKYLRAGEIAFRVKQNVITYFRAGLKLLELGSFIEGMIKDFGAQPAFPVNISINSIAAHKTPLPDEVVPQIMEGDVVKIDVGVHVDGYIADTAITLCIDDRFALLVDAAKEALEKSLSSIREGVRFSSIGGVIEETAKKYGLKSIRNLGGHSVGRYLIHAGDVIPNYNDITLFGKFRRGEAYAIEPFVSNGKGYVVELDEANIYALTKTKFKNLTSQELQLASYVMERFKTLPFCERWLLREINLPIDALRTVLNSLISKNIVKKYPILQEALSTAYVAQFEETVLISDDVLVITNPKF
ncbi:MAG: type II methionyl aminopeptidase [Sulfolobales archaeon]|nr:type II methionyl aminopeptidase [Sulfolobales archaeon]MCX8185531.1 type II methionyl aminopeptidase [Sulfolobales archaeon]MDW7969990.1 type II methionyl aminopeptidase [Sulfolobales archaeon]